MGMSGSWHWSGGLLFYALVFVVPCWQIVRKAGFNGAWALLSFVPLINIIALWFFAFSTWPKGRSAD